MSQVSQAGQEPHRPGRRWRNDDVDWKTRTPPVTGVSTQPYGKAQAPESGLCRHGTELLSLRASSPVPSGERENPSTVIVRESVNKIPSHTAAKDSQGGAVRELLPDTGVSLERQGQHREVSQ